MIAHSRQADREIARGGLLGVMHHPDALPQRDPRPWPAQDGCPVGRLCHLEVVHAGDVFDDAVACVVPDVHAKGEVCLGLQGKSGLARARRYL